MEFAERTRSSKVSKCQAFMMLVSSDDDGLTWSPVRRVPIDPGTQTTKVSVRVRWSFA